MIRFFINILPLYNNCSFNLKQLKTLLLLKISWNLPTLRLVGACSLKNLQRFYCSSSHHVPVMPVEVMKLMDPQNHQSFIDMTSGACGHIKALLKQNSNIDITAVDRDPTAHQISAKLSQNFPQINPVLACFSELYNFSKFGLKQGSYDGILFDLGASSMQFDQPDRGFSVSSNGPLDMRMNRVSNQPTAADVVNYIDEDGLYKILKKYGEEKNSRQIARAIVDSRHVYGPFKTTKQLADVVSSAFVRSHTRDKIGRSSHVATRTFQALRIFVNDELNELVCGLNVAHTLLKPGGICIIISFHSLEDRIVKQHFFGIDFDKNFVGSVKDQMRNPGKIYDKQTLNFLLEKKWTPKSKHVIVPSDSEIESNPRARSAKLRAAVKLTEPNEK